MATRCSSCTWVHVMTATFHTLDFKNEREVEADFYCTVQQNKPWISEINNKLVPPQKHERVMTS